MNNHLTLGALSYANNKRLSRFRNAKGEPAHKKDDGSDWSLNDWITAVTGELGEAANLSKKVRRGDFKLDDTIVVKGEPMTVRQAIAYEFADIIIYLDIAAQQIGVRLGEEVRKAFNFKSLEVLKEEDGFIMIDQDGIPCECFSREEAERCL